MKRRLAVVLVFILTVSFVCGCSGENHKAQETTLSNAEKYTALPELYDTFCERMSEVYLMYEATGSLTERFLTETYSVWCDFKDQLGSVMSDYETIGEEYGARIYNELCVMIASIADAESIIDTSTALQTENNLTDNKGD